MIAQGANKKMHEDFGIVVALEDGAPCLKRIAQLGRIHEIAVMGYDDVVTVILRYEGWHVMGEARARRRVPDMANGRPAGEALQISFAEHVWNEPHLPVLIKTRAVIGDYAGALLTAMLLRVQAKIRQTGGLLMVVYSH